MCILISCSIKASYFKVKFKPGRCNLYCIAPELLSPLYTRSDSLLLMRWKKIIEAKRFEIVPQNFCRIHDWGKSMFLHESTLSLIKLGIRNKPFETITLLWRHFALFGYRSRGEELSDYVASVSSFWIFVLVILSVL